MLFKEFADVDAFPICLDTKDADEIVRTVEAIAPGLRRHQPRGHLRAALLRDRAAAARVARHPRLPRRPARHGDRRARRAAQRAARRRQAARGRPRRHDRLRRRGNGGHPHPPARRRTWIVGCDEGGALYRGREGLNPAKREYAETTNPENLRGTADELLAGADVFIGVSVPGAISVEGVRRMAPRRDRLRDGEPESRGRPGGDRGPRRGDRDRPHRLPEPDQQRPRVPGHLPRRTRRPRARRSTPRWSSPPPARSRPTIADGRALARTTSSRASSTAPSRRRSRRRSPTRRSAAAWHGGPRRRLSPSVVLADAAAPAAGHSDMANTPHSPTSCPSPSSRHRRRRDEPRRDQLPARDAAPRRRADDGDVPRARDLRLRARGRGRRGAAPLGGRLRPRPRRRRAARPRPADRRRDRGDAARDRRGRSRRSAEAASLMAQHGIAHLAVTDPRADVRSASSRRSTSPARSPSERGAGEPQASG